MGFDRNGIILSIDIIGNKTPNNQVDIYSKGVPMTQWYQQVT